MKKTILLLMLAVCGLTAYADYSDYYMSRSNISFETPGWLVFFAIVSIAAAILQICLFFKLWKMTSDVNQIKRTIDFDFYNAADCKLDTLAIRVRNLHFSGRNETAFGLLNAFLYQALKKVELAEENEGIMTVIDGWDYSLAKTIIKPVDTYVKDSIAKLEPLYKLIGKEVPSELRTFSYEKFMAFTKEN